MFKKIVLLSLVLLTISVMAFTTGCSKKQTSTPDLSDTNVSCDSVGRVVEVQFVDDCRMQESDNSYDIVRGVLVSSKCSFGLESIIAAYEYAGYCCKVETNKNDCLGCSYLLHISKKW